MPSQYSFGGSLPIYNFFNHVEMNTANFVNSATIDDRHVFAAQYKVVIDQVAVDEGIFDTELRSDTVYYIDGTITIPSGTNIIFNNSKNFIVGAGSLMSGIVHATDSTTLFSSSSCGHVYLSNIFISVTGTSSQVFNLTDSDGSHFFQQRELLYTNCTSLGTISGFLQGIEFCTIRDGGTPTLTFTGTWGLGYCINDSLTRNLTNSTFSIYTCASGQSFGSRFTGNPTMILPSQVTAFTVAASNFEDGQFQLRGANFQGSGTVIADTDFYRSTKSLLGSNFGLASTVVGGTWQVSTEATTSMSSSGTAYKLAGTTTDYDFTWFELTSNNTITCLTTLVMGIQIYFSGAFISSRSNETFDLIIRFWDDSAGAYLSDATCHVGFTTNTSTRAESVSVFSRRIDITQNDRIEVWATSTASTSLQMLEGSQLTMLFFG